MRGPSGKGAKLESSLVSLFRLTRRMEAMYKDLVDLLREERRSIRENPPGLIDIVARKRKNLVALKELDARWREATEILAARVRSNSSSPSLEAIEEAWHYHDQGQAREFRRMCQRIEALVKDADELRRENRFLLHHNLNFVRGYLQVLRGEDLGGVYDSQGRKQGQTTSGVVSQIT